MRTSDAAGWTEPYVFAGNGGCLRGVDTELLDLNDDTQKHNDTFFLTSGVLGITAVAPLYDTDDSIMLGAAAVDYELVSIDEKLAEQVLGKTSASTSAPTSAPTILQTPASTSAPTIFVRAYRGISQIKCYRMLLGLCIILRILGSIAELSPLSQWHQ